jgi:hypothetical protein
VNPSATWHQRHGQPDIGTDDAASIDCLWADSTLPPRDIIGRAPDQPMGLLQVH